MHTQENPFTPPNADPSGRKRPRGSAVLAVFLGVLTDVGGSMTVGFLMTIVTGTMLVNEGAPLEEVEAALLNPDPTSWVSMAGYAVGCAFSFLGGYVCARVARYAEYLLGGVVAATVTAFGLLLGGGRMSVVLNVILVLLTVVSVMLGARRGAARNRAAG